MLHLRSETYNEQDWKVYRQNVSWNMPKSWLFGKNHKIRQALEAPPADLRLSFMTR